MFQPWQYLSKGKLLDLLKEMNFTRVGRLTPNRELWFLPGPWNGAVTVGSRLFACFGHRLLPFSLLCPPPNCPGLMGCHQLHVLILQGPVCVPFVSVSSFLPKPRMYFLSSDLSSLALGLHLGLWWKCRLPGPTSDILNLCFSKIPGGVPVHTEVWEALLYPQVTFLSVALIGSHIRCFGNVYRIWGLSHWGGRGRNTTSKSGQGRLWTACSTDDSPLQGRLGSYVTWLSKVLPGRRVGEKPLYLIPEPHSFLHRDTKDCLHGLITPNCLGIQLL